MSKETKELQRIIKATTKKMGWTTKDLAKVIFTEIHDESEDTVEKRAKFTETLKKQLTRKTTSPERLQEYLQIIIQDRDFQRLSLVTPNHIPSHDLDEAELIYLIDISKLITRSLENNIGDF